MSFTDIRLQVVIVSCLLEVSAEITCVYTEFACLGHFSTVQWENEAGFQGYSSKFIYLLSYQITIYSPYPLL